MTRIRRPGRGAGGPLSLVLAGVLVGTLAVAAAAQSPIPGSSPAVTLDPCVPVMVTGSPAASPSPCVGSAAGTSPAPPPDTLALPTATPAATPATATVQHAAVSASGRTPGKVRVRYGIAYMERRPCAEFRSGCINRADIYYPSNRGPWPVIVAVHGRPRTQEDMEDVAESLAAKGAVVFNVDYRGVRPVSKGFPESVSDVACAVRYARQNAGRYGGDRDHLVLVGHSMGGYVGAMVSLAGDTFPGATGACKSTLGMKASLPNGFVSVAGVSAVHHDDHLDQVFFGGTYQQIPRVWTRGTIYTHIGRHIGHNHRLKVGIIFERHDPYLGIGHATYLHAALRRAGYHSELILLSTGTTHFDILDTERDIGRRVVQFVWHIVRETDPD